MKLTFVKETRDEGNFHSVFTFEFRDEHDNKIELIHDGDDNKIFVNDDIQNYSYISKRLVMNPNKTKAKATILRYAKTYIIRGLKEQ